MTSPSGTESIDLAPRELLAVLTNDAERRHALAIFAEARSQSKGRNSSSRPGTSTDAAPLSSSPDGSTPVYTPPKSAGTTTASSRAPSASVSTPSPAPPVSPTAEPSQPSSSGKSQGKAKKSRRPHTSAGPRDSVDVRVGGAVPVPVPLLVPANGYASTPASSPDSRHGFGRSLEQPRSNGVPTPTRHIFELSMDGTRHSHDNVRSRTAADWTNGTLGAGAVQVPHSPVSPPPRNSSLSYHDRDGLLVNTEVGAGVRMDKVQPLDNTQPHLYYESECERRGRANDKTELIRAWEEELVKIEKASRRSSNMLAFWRKRDKPKDQLKQRIAT